jgi:hypothetical protein
MPTSAQKYTVTIHDKNTNKKEALNAFEVFNVCREYCTGAGTELLPIGPKPAAVALRYTLMRSANSKLIDIISFEHPARAPEYMSVRTLHF